MTFFFLSLWILLFFFSLSDQSSVRSPKKVPDYYWREYNGIIPCDALPGGRESNGRITYIGQSYYKRFELLPATIYQGSREAVSTAHTSEIRTDNNTKILCSPSPQHFSWIQVNTTISHLLTQCQQVIGGTEIDQILTIGRVNHQGSIITGKVFPNTITGKGLWIHSNGIPVNYESFELLIYNCIY